MIEEDLVARLHRAQVISRLVISHAGPVSAAVSNEVVPRVSFGLLLHHPITGLVFCGCFHESDLDPLQFRHRPTTKDKTCSKRDLPRLHLKPKMPTVKLSA